MSTMDFDRDYADRIMTMCVHVIIAESMDSETGATTVRKIEVCNALALIVANLMATMPDSETPQIDLRSMINNARAAIDESGATFEEVLSSMIR
jgi:hypothetical protein